MSLIITLLLVALIIFFFEILIPSGIMATFGILIMLGACYAAYGKYGVIGAVITFFVSVVLSLALLVTELVLLPKMPIGKKLFLKTRQKAASNVPQAAHDIIGKTGVALTTMAPTGQVLIEDKQYEAHSQSGLLGKGVPVRVVAQDAFKLTVVKAE